MSTMSEPLEWTELSENEHHAHRDMAHYIVYKRSDGKWTVPIFSMFIDAPDQVEEKLGEYVATTLEDGKEIAQALADTQKMIDDHFVHYADPYDVLNGEYVTDELMVVRGRRLVTGLGTRDDDGTELAYVGIEEGDNYAAVLLTTDELRAVIANLTDTLVLMIRKLDT
jgi:hypothetical protein